ncbi:MAG TPA: sialate O-acetylesterase [Allosphingosinicella sp.]|nr:sialate O-acetylesterase [Allosphingosinicella sp.]
MRRLLPAAALAALFAGAAHAAPVLDPLFSDHAVLQRERAIVVWGEAAPRELLTVSLGGASRSVTAGGDGRWRVELPAMPAGGPYDLTVVGTKGASARAQDVLVGDVWLCSGQSNMEFPVGRALNGEAEVAGASDAHLRILTVPKKTAAAPAAGFGGPISWAPASPHAVRDFSAACYFMVRELRASEKVPIGAIAASWGGTAIRSWMDEAAGRAVGGEDAALLDLYRRDPAAANLRFGERWQAWWRARSPLEPWRDPAGLAWKPMPRIGYWEGWGDPAFAAFNGMMWARKTFTLSREEAARLATLSLGVVDEIEQTWVNGVPVGNTFGWDVARDYPLPRGLLREGENVILVNLYDAYGAGGFQGPAEVLKLGFAGGGARALGEGWEYAVAPSGLGEPPRPPWDAAAGLSLIHNGMIAPLGPFGFRGVAWYQGETDGGMPAGYAEKLRAMMAGWRRQFGAPELPFLIVSLANFGPPALVPRASGWAEIREAQRQVTMGDEHAGLVVAIDLGDRLDIHPANKQEVGRRLARAARALAYGAQEPAGPEAVRVRRTGGEIAVEFAGVTGALRSWSGSSVVGVELCGTTQESCRYALAVAQGGRLLVADDGKPATRVRYAWADSPVVNLYDEAPLPPGPFELPIE